MKIFLLCIFYMLLVLTTAGQVSRKENQSTKEYKVVPVDRHDDFVDSLRETILSDTTKYNRNNLLHSSLGTRNELQYSKLYLINGRYAYKLDIVEPRQVMEFVAEYLDSGKIASITTLDTLYSSALYGLNGLPGAIIITLKKGTKFNPKVAGLIMKSKKYGDNFDQRKTGEILIHE